LSKVQELVQLMNTDRYHLFTGRNRFCCNADDL